MANEDFSLEDFDIQPISDAELVDLDFEFVEATLQLPSDFTDELEDISSVNTASQATVEAQASADEAVENGDYAAAAQFRETAEDSAWDAGDRSNLVGPTASELEVAAEHQAAAEALEQSQAEHAANGDYLTAKEDAQAAADHIQSADFLANGSDHAGTAELEVVNMDWAVWHQDISDGMLADAMDYANDGNLSAADHSLQQAIDEQTTADHFGDLGEHGNVIADVDPSSETTHHDFNSYSVNDSSTSSTAASVDTGVDTSSTIDSGTDDFSTDV